MDFYFRLYNKSHMGEIYKTSCFLFYFQYQVLQNNKSVVILTKRSLKMSTMGKKKKKISLQDGGHPPTCEILHQLISRYVIEHTKRKKNRRFPLCSCTNVHRTDRKQAGRLTCSISRVPETTILLNPPIKSDFFLT